MSEASKALAALRTFRDCVQKAERARQRAEYGGAATFDRETAIGDRWDEKADEAYEIVAEFIQKSGSTQ